MSVALVLAGAVWNEGGEGLFQVLEPISGPERVPVAGVFGWRPGSGDHKHSEGTFCVVADALDMRH